MSRLLVAALAIAALSPRPTYSQSLTDTEIATEIERARRLVAVDDEGCVKYPVGDEIVVCGTNEENERQKLPIPQPRYGPGDRVPGEALPTTYLEKVSAPGIGFGYVPPVALDYHELMKGLPEPDMVVPEGSTPE